MFYNRQDNRILGQSCDDDGCGCKNSGYSCTSNLCVCAVAKLLNILNKGLSFYLT